MVHPTRHLFQCMEEYLPPPTQRCCKDTYAVPVKAIVPDAKVKKKSLYIAWLDNAIGCIPYDAIQATLQHIGVPATLSP